MKLKVLTGPRRDEELVLPDDGKLTIGRSESCDFCVEDQKISREHCTLEWDSDSWTLVDGGSANGTWVAGDRVVKRRLVHGDTITLGDTTLELIDESDPGAPVELVDAIDARAAEAEARTQRRREATGARRGSNLATLAVTLLIAALLVYLVMRQTGDDTSGGSAKSKSDRTRVAKGDSSKTAGSKKSASGKGDTVASKTAVDGDPEKGAAGSKKEPDVARVRSPKRRGREERLRGLIDDKLPLLLAEHDYKRALSVILYHSRVTGGFGALADAERNKVRAAAQRHLDETLEELARLSDENKAEEARELVFDRLMVFPPRFADKLHLAYDRFATRDERADNEQLEREHAEVFASMAVRRAIAALDFKKAQQAIASAKSHEGPGALAAETIVRLERRVRVAEGAWKGIVSAIERRVASKSRFRLPIQSGREIVMLRATGGFDLVRATKPISVKIDSIVGSLVDASTSDGGRVICDALALSDEWLVGEVRKRVKDLTDVELLEGTGLLLCLREGPARVARFVETAVSDEALSRGMKDHASGLRDFWLVERRKRLRVAANYLETDPKVSARDWLRQSVRIAELARLWRPLPSYRRHSGGLLGEFRDARLEHLRRDPPRRTFRARQVELKGDSVRLMYDFSEDDQLKDIVALGEKTTLRRNGGGLVLKGECRFFDGSPFVGRLAVDLRLSAGGYNGSRPNISVALWTAHGNSLTPTSSMSLTLSMQGAPVRYADYFVFGYGYYAAPYDFGGTPISQVRPPDSEKFLDLPGHVIFLGRHGTPLHRFAGECVWARSTKQRFGGNLELHVEAGPHGAAWMANGRPIFAKAPALLTKFLSQRERVGSISLLTNGEAVRIRSIEIEGQLDPVWLQGTFQAAIDNELRRLFD